MFDQLSHGYAQMQPGDKMQLMLHKGQPKPQQPQYQMPGAQPNAMPAGPDASMGGAAPAGGALMGGPPEAMPMDPGAVGAMPGGPEDPSRRAALMSALQNMVQSRTV